MQGVAGNLTDSSQYGAGHPQIAVFHHRFKHYGGAERVADALADTLDADLYTLYVSDRCRKETDAEPLLQEKYNTGVTGRVYRRLAVENLVRSIDVEHVDLSEYDIVITSGDFAHFFLPTDEQRHIHYLHTPNRDFWNAPEYRAMAGGRLMPIKTLYFQWLRGRDLDHAQHVDEWICNSQFIAERAMRFYDADDDDITVINPPVGWEGLGDVPSADERGDYWLTLGRIVPAKRLDIMIEAVRGTDHELVIAGDGWYRDELESGAPDNVEFKGYVDEASKRDLLRNARGFLFMGERECFGMSVAEALSAGTPVIGAPSGNIPNMVHPDSQPLNGVLVEANPEALREALERANRTPWDHEAIREAAERYSRARFDKEIRMFMNETKMATGQEIPA